MKRCLFCASISIVCVLAISSSGEPQSPKTEKEKQLTSNQLLMRDKLKQMNRVLEGITLNNFGEVQDSANTLGMISRAASWHISDPSARYERLSKNFQEEASDLERHAKERNADAATLDLVRINVTCTACHQHMRENMNEAR
jgi:hypothetical protein